MKGNMLLGYGHGSVGDVTFYRRDGKLCARARNRNPKNPKTNAQLYTRAIMATVLRAYSSGKAIFDHSFEGKSIPSGNMQYFIKRNTKLLRQYLAADLSDAPYKFRGVGPETITPVPGLYMISEGSLIQDFFIKDGGRIDRIQTPAAASATETISEYMTRVGIAPGDIFTFCMFGNNSSNVVFEIDDSDVRTSKQYAGIFSSVRLTVKTPNDSSQPIEGTALGNLFEMTNVSNVTAAELLSATIGATTPITQAFTITAGFEIRSYGIIRSREDSGLRSTEYMTWFGDDDEALDYFGLTSEYILTAWKLGATKVGNSEYILEGGGV